MILIYSPLGTWQFSKIPQSPSTHLKSVLISTVGMLIHVYTANTTQIEGQMEIVEYQSPTYRNDSMIVSKAISTHRMSLWQWSIFNYTEGQVIIVEHMMGVIAYY